MNIIVLSVIILFVLLAPVRIGSWLLGAKRQGWWASFLVLFLGSIFVNVFAFFLPEAWLADPFIRAGLIFGVFVFATMGLLEMTFLRAAILSIVICAVYSFSLANPGAFGASVG
jgi:hypothetical protein